MHLLLLNPNSCSDLTDALERLLVPPPDVCLSFLTADARLGAPAAIDDEPSADRSTVACLRLVQEDPTARELVRATDGVLVCCFSDHPLVAALRTELGPQGPLVLGIFEAALSTALNLARSLSLARSLATISSMQETNIKEGRERDGGDSGQEVQTSDAGVRFAILTTVEGMCPGIDAGVGRFLASASTARVLDGREDASPSALGKTECYGGSFAAGVGVLDLHPPSPIALLTTTPVATTKPLSGLEDDDGSTMNDGSVTTAAVADEATVPARSASPAVQHGSVQHGSVQHGSAQHSSAPSSSASSSSSPSGALAAVHLRIRQTAGRCRTLGRAQIVLLGCAGMSGLEPVVRRGWLEAADGPSAKVVATGDDSLVGSDGGDDGGGVREEQGEKVVVVDAVQAGVDVLVGLCREKGGRHSKDVGGGPGSD